MSSVTMNIVAYGHPLGTLRYCPPSTPLRSRDRQLLSDLAGHLGGVMQTRQLIADLQRMLERLVLAREEERRRLRRDLHDGLGPALAGHLLQLDVVAGKLVVGASVAEDVDRLRAELRATVLEVRRVVEGLRPAALDELGLSGALKQSVLRLSAGSATSVELRVGELPPLSAAIEVAAFRITTEAVSNAIRHAGASTCLVDIHVADDRLRISVTDDGCGVAVDPVTIGGNGLQTMRERVEELRGHLRVASDSGTTVWAELPLPGSSRSPLRTSPARLS